MPNFFLNLRNLPVICRPRFLRSVYFQVEVIRFFSFSIVTSYRFLALFQLLQSVYLALQLSLRNLRLVCFCTQIHIEREFEHGVETLRKLIRDVNVLQLSNTFHNTLINEYCLLMEGIKGQ